MMKHNDYKSRPAGKDTDDKNARKLLNGKTFRAALTTTALCTHLKLIDY